MKNILILGSAPNQKLAPVGSDDWETWACSPGTYHIPGIDKFFELHRWQPGVPWFSEGYVNYLKNFPGQVIMTEPVDDIPGCTILDHKMLIEEFGPYFFTSSIAWMLAIAIMNKPDKIALYGVDMAAQTEYKDQRLGCQYFCAIAKARGIEVGVPPESDLLRPAPLYGVCEQSHGWIKQTARNQELVMRATRLKEEIDAKNLELHFVNGCLDDQDWTLQSWFGAEDTLGKKHCEPVLVPALDPGVKGVELYAEPKPDGNSGVIKPVLEIDGVNVMADEGSGD